MLFEKTDRTANTLRGTIESVIYQAEEFTVASFKPDGELMAVRITGPMPGIVVGMELLLQGQWGKHPKYGEQFQVESFGLEIPRTKKGLARYLGSGLIPGIGPSLAERIVAKFGLNAISVLDNRINDLTKVTGIGQKKLEKIKEAWAEQRKIANLMSLLAELGAGPALAARIYKYFEGNLPPVKNRGL